MIIGLSREDLVAARGRLGPSHTAEHAGCAISLAGVAATRWRRYRRTATSTDRGRCSTSSTPCAMTARSLRPRPRTRAAGARGCSPTPGCGHGSSPTAPPNGSPPCTPSLRRRASGAPEPSLMTRCFALPRRAWDGLRDRGPGFQVEPPRHPSDRWRPRRLGRLGETEPR